MVGIFVDFNLYPVALRLFANNICHCTSKRITIINRQIFHIVLGKIMHKQCCFFHIIYKDYFFLAATYIKIFSFILISIGFFTKKLYRFACPFPNISIGLKFF